MLDTLNQSAPQTPLPDDIQARIENARNNITIMEAEFSRLQKLSLELESKIKTQHVEMKSCEESINSLRSVEKALMSDVANLEVNKGNLTDSIIKAKSELAQIQEETKQLKEINNIEIAGINERENALEEKEKDIVKRIVDLEKKEVAHSQKVERLLKAIE